MSSLFGNLLGVREDALYYHQDTRNFQNVPWASMQSSPEELAHLRKGGIVYHYGWTWRSKHGSTHSIRVGPYFDNEIGEREFITTLFEAGYRLPRWWEIYRWGERRLDKDQRKAIAALEKNAKLIG